MASRIITRGLRTGIGIGGVKYILLRGLVSDDNPPDPSESRLIVIAIINRLKAISISAGYFTDINNCIEDWQLTDIPISNLPCIEVKDISEESEIKGLADYRILNVEIIGRITISDMNTARNFQQDMESVMLNGPTYPKSVYLSRLIERSELSVDQNNKKVAMITMNYEVKYRV